jgi:hypothetical protein
MVHDLAVADDCEPAVRTEDRLVSAREVDDAEASHSKAEITIDMDALVVGAAVDEWAALGFDIALFDRAAAPSVPASDPAHLLENALPAQLSASPMRRAPPAQLGSFGGCRYLELRSQNTPFEESPERVIGW